MIIGGLPRAHFDVTLDDGRVVNLERVFFDYTYEGVLEGDPSFMAPRVWYDAALAHAERLYGLGKRQRFRTGVTLVEPALRHTPPYPSRPHVPYVRVFAFCTSWHRAAGSALALVWFQDSFDEPLLERLRSALGVVRWDAHCIEWED
jgi:hypothetical protein